MLRGRSYAIDRMLITPMDFDVPLNWKDSSGAIRVHANEVVAAEKRDDPKLPCLCYFQGGPGFEAPRPEERSGWLKEALERYRVVLLDERGTGQSTPLDAHALPRMDNLAEYLRNFRADSIVRDAEHVRRALLGDNGRWTIMGHSFGGFCTVTYLSLFPEHLNGVINIAGFAPILRGADEVYIALAERVVERNRRHFQRFPEDVERVVRIVSHLKTGTEVNRHGETLIPQQFLAIGEWFGNLHGSALVHTLLERASNDLDQLGRISYLATAHFTDVMRVTTNPIYAVLHEAIYSQGPATRWAAHRIVEQRSEFGLDHNPPNFTGEMIFPWMFDALPALRPLHDVAHELANYERWSTLFDVPRLQSNDIPVVGCVFWDDLYVHRDYALETANLIGNCDIWLTNELEHRGPWEDPSKTMTRVFALLDQKIGPG